MKSYGVYLGVTLSGRMRKNGRRHITETVGWIRVIGDLNDIDKLSRPSSRIGNSRVMSHDGAASDLS